MGSTGFIEIEAMWRNQRFINSITNYVNGGYISHNIVHVYKTTTSASNDRLNGTKKL